MHLNSFHNEPFCGGKTVATAFLNYAQNFVRFRGSALTEPTTNSDISDSRNVYNLTYAFKQKNDLRTKVTDRE